MDVGALLEGAIHAGDQVDLLFELLQRLHCWSEFGQRLDCEIRILLAQRLHDVAKVTLGDDVVRFAREEPAPDDSDGYVEVSHPLGDGFGCGGSADAFHPWQREGCAADAAEEGSSGGGSHGCGLIVRRSSVLTIDASAGSSLLIRDSWCVCVVEKRFTQDNLL